MVSGIDGGKSSRFKRPKAAARYPDPPGGPPRVLLRLFWPLNAKSATKERSLKPAGQTRLVEPQATSRKGLRARGMPFSSLEDRVESLFPPRPLLPPSHGIKRLPADAGSPRNPAGLYSSTGRQERWSEPGGNAVVGEFLLSVSTCACVTQLTTQAQRSASLSHWQVAEAGGRIVQVVKRRTASTRAPPSSFLIA
jgi:hypothetical protein